MGSKKIFLKVTVLVHFEEIIFSLRRIWFPYKAENKNSKKGKNGKEEEIFESSNYGPFWEIIFSLRKILVSL